MILRSDLPNTGFFNSLKKRWSTRHGRRRWCSGWRGRSATPGSTGPRAAALMAAELGLEASKMQKVLEAHVRAHLDELAEVRLDLH